MKKVLIELATGRLCDIVDSGAVFSVASGLEWHDAPADVSHETHVWNGYAVVLKPPKPLDEVKAEKLAKIKADRNAAITGGFTYLNKPIDSDRDSVMAITGAAVAALAAKAAGLPYSVTWTCADDSTLTLDADGVLGMSVTLAQFADAQHTKGRPLKDAVKAATTVDALENINW